jgi:hypothetical protein
MRETPRTDAEDAVADQNYGIDIYRNMVEHARQLERELAEAKRELDWTRDTLQKRIEADRAHVSGQANLASTLTKEAGNGRG